jgi:hypothetical protein
MCEAGGNYRPVRGKSNGFCPPAPTPPYRVPIAFRTAPRVDKPVDKVAARKALMRSAAHHVGIFVRLAR